MLLRCRQFDFTFPRPVLIMGVVNVTPDSFSDGGQFLDTSAAVHRAVQLIHEGADIIDIGGESTRPAATPVKEEEELRRVIPVIQQLAASESRVPISIDTTKPGVARAALEAGASLVNDVAANRQALEMWRVVKEAGAGYVAMHMKGTPQTMHHNPVYTDVVAEIDEFFSQQLSKFETFGIRPEHVILDVGIGFGKTVQHNLELLARLQSFTKWERPLLLGASRKSFVGQVTGVAEAGARLAGSLACACWGVEHGVNLVRVHDVAATREAIRMTEAMMARKKNA